MYEFFPLFFFFCLVLVNFLTCCFLNCILCVCVHMRVRVFNVCITNAGKRTLFTSLASLLFSKRRKKRVKELFIIFFLPSLSYKFG